MTFARLVVFATCVTSLAIGGQALAVRFITDPATSPGDPPTDFVSFSLTPDGTQVIAAANFDADDDRVYGFTIPNDLSSTVNPVQLSTTSFLVENYDVDGVPIVSPDGNTILYIHDGRQRDPSENTIHTMPITGESGDFNGLFSGTAAGPNTVAPGNSNFTPRYSPDGSTIFFINSESGFGGTIPPWDTGSNGANSPSTFPSVWAAPDWDVLYSVPAAGGTPTAVTMPSDGDIDEDLYAVTPNGATIVYAPDAPIATPRNRGDDRPTIYTVPATGGASTAISMTPGPNEKFTVSGMLEVTPDGQNVVFIGDYDTAGKNELYSLPLAGGTPTKLNDELHFAGDVRSFAISPDGLSVAYAAGQTVGSTSELFFKSLAGAAGTSVRISDPAPSNTAGFDVSNGSGAGNIAFSPDSQTVYYLGDMTNAGAVDLYAVDTTEKTGFSPSAYTYVGTDGGDFTLAANWEDADGNPLPANISTIDNQGITPYTLIVDGDLIGGNKTVTAEFVEQIQFGLGASLEIKNGAEVRLTNGMGIADPADIIATVDFDPGSALKIVNGSLIVNDDVLFDGMLYMENATLESTADDIEFQDEYDGTIINSTLRAGDNLLVDTAMGNITGSNFEIQDGLSIRFDSDITVTDTDIVMSFDVEPLFTWSDGEGTTLTLKGTSTLTADSVNEGSDLILEDESFASLGSLDIDPASSSANPPSIMVATNTVNDFGYVGEDYVSQIIFMSYDAELETRFSVLEDPDGVIDARSLIINGLTGLSYLEDPSAFTAIVDGVEVTWDGDAPLDSLMLASTTTVLGGDFNDDGVVNIADYVLWRNNLGSPAGTLDNDTAGGDIGAAQYDLWKANFGMTLDPPAAVAAVPEPSTIVLLSLLFAVTGSQVRRRRV
ncbi:PEP-CTERM sorting domain-containing protein [Aeoliella sp.]|uniref:PEP-CTERM sorting domain-containing protein n=1 Tax=Aeoliella sp. TaxID=2795800 RepID=UPI003CCB9BC1